MLPWYSVRNTYCHGCFSSSLNWYKSRGRMMSRPLFTSRLYFLHLSLGVSPSIFQFRNLVKPLLTLCSTPFRAEKSHRQRQMLNGSAISLTGWDSAVQASIVRWPVSIVSELEGLGSLFVGQVLVVEVNPTLLLQRSRS